MPQLDFSTFVSQIFWLAVTFSLLYYVMARFSLPRVREVLQSRQERIRGDLDKADTLQKEAERVEAEYQNALNQARQKASEVLNANKKALQAEAEKRHARLDDMFARQNKEAEQRIAQLRKEANESLGEVAEEIAQHIAKKLLGMDVSKDQAQKIREKLRKAS